jgi:hypothetical protein
MVLFLLVCEVGGAALLNFFGISLPVVQLAGGLVLAAIGLRMLDQNERADVQTVSIGEVHATACTNRATYVLRRGDPFSRPLASAHKHSCGDLRAGKEYRDEMYLCDPHAKNPLLDPTAHGSYPGQSN